MIRLVTGVSGAGKTTVGRRLARALHAEFLDADDFHPAANVEKMSRGVALTDEDRAGWLDRLRKEIDRRLAAGADAVVAVSALKRAHRERLGAGRDGVQVIFLDAPRGVLADRLSARTGHFFDPALLDSQLEALEPPANALRVDATLPPDEIVGRLSRRA